MKYKINHTDGKSEILDLSEISSKLSINCEIFENEKFLGVVSRNLLITFCLDHAEYALDNFSKKVDPRSRNAITAGRKYLLGEISLEEMKTAAYAANAANPAYAANAAAYAANAAAYAANPANPANAANAAANAAYAAYAAAYAANAAAYAANPANPVANAAKKKELERQGTFIISFMKSRKWMFCI